MNPQTNWKKPLMGGFGAKRTGNRFWGKKLSKIVLTGPCTRKRDVLSQTTRDEKNTRRKKEIWGLGVLL